MAKIKFYSVFILLVVLISLTAFSQSGDNATSGWLKEVTD